MRRLEENYAALSEALSLAAVKLAKIRRILYEASARGNLTAAEQAIMEIIDASI
jgi:hypothetical protein